MNMQGLVRPLALAAVFAVATSASAQISIPSANLGTDGSLNPFQNRTIMLQNAPTGLWDQAGDGRGVYDAEKWAVVYKYSSVSIPANVTVNFANHPSGAPVVWLVSGDVTINGTVTLNGGNGFVGLGAPNGGPGGFSGGQGGFPFTSGRGPGGGRRDAFNQGTGGGFGTFGTTRVTGEVGGYVYGTGDLVPLIGGSGGSADTGTRGGGAGGGAILVVASGTITLNGSIAANGGNACCGESGSGSGGGIRLVCNSLTGIGSVTAIGGNGGNTGGFGRIRTETNNDTLATPGLPERSRGTDPITIARLWPDATEPKVTAVSLGGRPVPADPRALCTFGNTDVELNSATPAILTINARNVPLASEIWVRIVPATQGQNEQRVQASFQTGTFQSSTWAATLPVSNGCSTFTISVVLP